MTLSTTATARLFLLFLCFCACRSQPSIPGGGYDYPTGLNPQDTNFYGYPIKDLLSKKDSFYWYQHHKFYNALGEPNLSLKPLEHETYRFEYSTAFRDFVVITLADNSLIVKEGNSSDFLINDTSMLTPIENKHLELLWLNYPIDPAQKNPYKKAYLDSMTRLYPQLLQSSYFNYLIQKSFRISKDASSYTTTKIPLPKKTFDSLINAINTSGFWQMPYEIECDQDMADGHGFQLEANTRHKYQVVSVQGCPDDTSRFTKVCQRIIHYARPKTAVELIWSGKTSTVVPIDVQLEEVQPKKNDAL
jgi:hypothetical protein